MSSTIRPGKTVYVLGAGSSAAAGGPLQAELLGKILDPELAKNAPDLDKIGLEEYQWMVLDFIEAVFGLKGLDAAGRLALEDLFTVIDRALLSESAIKGWSPYRIRDVRRGLAAGLVHFMQETLQHPRSNLFDEFARAIVQNHNEERPPDIVSLNWDILVDNAMGRGEPNQ